MTRTDAIFDLERGINGSEAAARREAQKRLVQPLVDDFDGSMLAARHTI